MREYLRKKHHSASTKRQVLHYCCRAMDLHKQQKLAASDCFKLDALLSKVPEFLRNQILAEQRSQIVRSCAFFARLRFLNIGELINTCQELILKKSELV